MAKFPVKKWAGTGASAGEQLIIGWKKTQTNQRLKTLERINLGMSYKFREKNDTAPLSIELIIEQDSN
jgi:hypothetical protein